MPEYRLKIRRFDPESGEAAYWADYTSELPPERSVLDGILQVKDREDASIGIRCSCRAAICGSCGVRINGRSRLACNTKIGDAAAGARDGAITVEPMGNMPVIKDLITDMEAVHWKKVQRVVPWLLPAEEPPEGREYTMPAEAMLDVTQAMACIHCGVCVSACLSMEVDPDFIGPAALAKAYRFVGDPRDGEHEARLRDLAEDPHGIYDCTHCFACVEVCPKDVAPMKQITRELPTAARGLLSGKVSPKKALIHPKLPDQSQVRRIFKEIESKDERLELNLYIVGEEAGEPGATPIEEEPATSEGRQGR